MKGMDPMRITRIATLCLMVIPAVPGLVHAQAAAASSPKKIEVTVDAAQVSPPVSKYEYGMFIEHIRTLIYRSLWAEMLDDRKFYHPITSGGPKAPPGGVTRRFRMFLSRRWRPVGPDAFVVMDTEQPFVGEHSPRIDLDSSVPHGIRQGGLTLVGGKRYTGHIVLRGNSGARVKVSLVWGEGPNGRQTITIGALPVAYQEFPLRFTSRVGTSEGALEITGTGSGSFRIGAVSVMPADNVDGFRPDTIALLRRLHSGFWRLPGGNFVSDFNWYDSVGPRDKRPPILDHAWNAVQSNDVGMDEFMTLCKLIGTEPYITVNAGFGDAHSAAEEVEYMNGAVSTRLGALRARNGHPVPYHVKFWNIGNEPYGPWELGRTDLKYYVLKHNEFARAMRKVDPSIVLLASGAMPDEETIEGIASELHLKDYQVPFCSDADWTCGYLKHSWGLFDGITEHWYSRAGVRFDLEAAKKGKRYQGMEAGYVPVKQTVLQWVRKPSNRVHLKAEEWQEYERRFPGMIKKHIFMSNDEYAYTARGFREGPNLKLALAYAMVFNEMLRHTDFLRMTAFTMGVSTLDISPVAAVLNTNGLLFKLYGDHMGAGMLPVAVTGNSPQPLPEQHPFDGFPHTNAGSPTYPLDVVAALSPDRKHLILSVVNATDSAVPLTLHVNGARVTGKTTLWKMTGKDLNAANRVGQSPQVQVKKVAVTEAGNVLSVPPISVDIYRFPVAPRPQ